MDVKKVGIGPSSALDLRVSVATLTKVLIPWQIGDVLLALEHKATVIPENGDRAVLLRAQPFGGAVRLLDPGKLEQAVARFHFDSERSRSESDLRLFINQGDWVKLRDFCLEEFKEGRRSALETDPTRELQEEFQDTLGFEILAEQYQIKPLGTFVEDQPQPTANLYAAGALTARVYFTFEAMIIDPDLEQVMVENSDSHSPQVLRRLALADRRQGGRGRANAVLALRLGEVQRAFKDSSSTDLRKAVEHRGFTLDGNVRVILH